MTTHTDTQSEGKKKIKRRCDSINSERKMLRLHGDFNYTNYTHTHTHTHTQLHSHIVIVTHTVSPRSDIAGSHWVFHHHWGSCLLATVRSESVDPPCQSGQSVGVAGVVRYEERDGMELTGWSRVIIAAMILEV